MESTVEVLTKQLRFRRVKEKLDISEAKRKSLVLTQYSKLRFNRTLQCFGNQNFDNFLHRHASSARELNSPPRAPQNVKMDICKSFEHFNKSYNLEQISALSTLPTLDELYRNLKFVPIKEMGGEEKINTEKQIWRKENNGDSANLLQTENQRFPGDDTEANLLKCANEKKPQRSTNEDQVIPAINLQTAKNVTISKVLPQKGRHTQSTRLQTHHLKVSSINRPSSARSNASRRSSWSRKESLTTVRPNHWVDNITISGTTCNGEQDQSRISKKCVSADNREGILPQLICPSSAMKSQKYLCNVWISQSSFKGSIRTVPLL